MHFGDAGIQGRSARSQADRFLTIKPVRIEVCRALDVKRGDAFFAATHYQLTGVVGVFAAYNDHRFNLVKQVYQGLLMLLGGMANGVDKTDIGSGIKSGNGDSYFLG